MTNAVTVLPTFGGPRTYNAPIENELGAGIEPSYGTLSCKGKVWKTRYKGEEHTLMRPDNDGPRNSIEVVIVRAAKVKSKKYYAGGFVEGAARRPDCKSSNGVVPDADVVNKQSNVCATCPKNQFGSAPMRADGTKSKGKACPDSKRISVVFANPAADAPAMLQNTLYGGPLLFQVPATSLGALQVYGDRLAKSGYNSWAVITKISFDPKEAYPKLVFEPARPLTTAEQEVADELHGSYQVQRMIAEDRDEDGASDEAPVQFTAPLPTQAPNAPAAPALTVVPASSPPAPPAAVTPPVTETGLPQSFEAQLDALLGK